MQSEIEEREQFVAHMRGCKRPKREYEHIRLEVAGRLKELERLDTLIQAELIK